MSVAVAWAPMTVRLEGDLSTETLTERLEAHRRELNGYCYRMLGSAFEAEDAVQETMVRAWKAIDSFEGRSSLRSWLYRIATNVCLDMLTAGNKRARPMDLTESTPLAQAALSPRPDNTWLEPMPDSRVLPSTEDPAEAAVAKESVRLAFMAALQRARATLAEREGHGADATVSDPLDEEQQKLLDRYMAAFEGYDMTALTALLHEDAIMTMPPFDLWLTGHDDIAGFMTTLGSACEGSRLVPVQVNGLPGFAQYKPDPEAGGYTPWAVQVLEISEGRLTGFHFFLDTKRWFPLFGLPLHLDALEAESDQVEEGV